MLTLLTRLLRPATPAVPLPRPTPAAAGADAERPLGCGWFDSSHDLQHGVTVWEGIIVVDNTVASPS